MLTKIKNEPRHPQKAPMTIAAGISRSVFSSDSKVPNFKVAASVKEKGEPVLSAVKIESKKVHIDEPKKTRHSILNVQNVLGLEISYENKDPPIGEPNAAETPADAPAATNYLLITSFRKHLKPLIGI